MPRRWAQKNRRPRLRTSGVAPVVPPHFAAPLARAASAARPGSSEEVHRTMHRPVNGGRSTLSGHPSPPTAPGRIRAFPSGSERGSEVFSPGVFGPASQLPRFSCPSGRQVTRPHRRRFGLHLSSDPSKPPVVCQPLGCRLGAPHGIAPVVVGEGPVPSHRLQDDHPALVGTVCPPASGIGRRWRHGTLPYDGRATDLGTTQNGEAHPLPGTSVSNPKWRTTSA